MSMTISDMSGATFSADRVYRQLLWRIWEESGKLLNVIGCNPSKAGEIESDPTISRQIERAKRLGCGGLLMTNAYDLVATNPKDMKRHVKPLSEAADEAIVAAAKQADASGGIILAAWGRNVSEKRWVELMRLLDGFDLYCLGVNADDSPVHPLYIGYDVVPRRYA